MIEIEMPWPPSGLRPNRARTRHWASNGAEAARYKADCAILCRAAGLRKIEGIRPHLTMRFCPPDRKRRDLDADLSASKAMIDAIATAIDVDDYLFSYSLFRGEPVKSGCVLVTITEAV